MRLSHTAQHTVATTQFSPNSLRDNTPHTYPKIGLRGVVMSPRRLILSEFSPPKSIATMKTKVFVTHTERFPVAERISCIGFLCLARSGCAVSRFKKRDLFDSGDARGRSWPWANCGVYDCLRLSGGGGVLCCICVGVLCYVVMCVSCVVSRVCVCLLAYFDVRCARSLACLSFSQYGGFGTNL